MKHRIICRDVDVTEYVARLYDALRGSTDQGPGFFYVERHRDAAQVEALLVLGEVAGFEMLAVGEEGWAHPPGVDPQLIQGDTWEQIDENRGRIAREVTEAWREQVSSKVQGLLVEAASEAPQEQGGEVSRLTTALHANVCHPDYEYVPTFGAGEVPEGTGWERNPHAEAARGWQSGAGPGDKMWMRARR